MIPESIADDIARSVLEQIYIDHQCHIDFIDDMSDGDCDCGVHHLLQLLTGFLT